MKHIGTPAIRLMPQSIIRSFQGSKKKHLLITGSRGSGKSTLALALAEILCRTEGKAPLPGITTFAVPGKMVILRENRSGQEAVIGRYEKPADGEAGEENCMKPEPEGLLGLGREALLRCAGTAGAGEWVERSEDWVLLDELGYLEKDCGPFLAAVEALFSQKRVLAVLRKQPLPHLEQLAQREDVFLYDLDTPVPPLGCVVMASGLGRRFGGNKLLARLGEATLLERALEQTDGIFTRRVAVTRHPEAARICQKQQAEWVLHDLPGRNDTVRLGVEALEKDQEPLAGYLFCPADQPLLTRETLEVMALEFGRTGGREEIFRLCAQGCPGAPVLFGRGFGEALKSLPQGKGGSWLLQRFPERIHLVEAAPWELWDVDRAEDLKKCEDWIEREEREGI